MAKVGTHHIQASCTTNVSDLVKQAMKIRGYTQKMLAENMGYRGPNSVAMNLGPGRNMQINVLAMMLDELGFDLIVKDRNSNNKDNMWKVELIASNVNNTNKAGESE